MAAVRELGGRFLELDERTDTYFDVGDKKATEKTSQALREGQAQTRKNIYRDESAAAAVAGLQPNLSAIDSPAPNQQEISELGYFGYSLHVLDALYTEHEGTTSHAPVAIVPTNVPSSVTTIANNDAMAMALDQFPIVPPIQEMTTFTDSALPLAGTNDVRPWTADVRPSFGRLTNMSLTSLLSIGSIRELRESARDENHLPSVEWMGARGTMMSLPSSEVRALIRTSEPQLAQIENVAFEVMNERVSELRCTEMCKDLVKIVCGEELNHRNTDCTFYSRSSLMDASMMTIDRDDMSFFDGKLTFSEPKEQQECPPIDDAELPLGMTVKSGP